MGDMTNSSWNYKDSLIVGYHKDKEDTTYIKKK